MWCENCVPIHYHNATSNSTFSKVLVFFDKYPFEVTSKYYSNTLNSLFDLEEEIYCAQFSSTFFGFSWFYSFLLGKLPLSFRVILVNPIIIRNHLKKIRTEMQNFWVLRDVFSLLFVNNFGTNFATILCIFKSLITFAGMDHILFQLQGKYREFFFRDLHKYFHELLLCFLTWYL